MARRTLAELHEQLVVSVAPKPTPKPTKYDHRRLPRKPAHLRRTTSIMLRVTAKERRTLRARAAKAGKTMADYISCKALGVEDRP